MGRRREVDELLETAECERRCAVTADVLLERALRRRCRSDLVRPRPGCYARRAHWERLGRMERERHIVRGYARAHRGWIYCQATAALMHGLPVSVRHLARLHVLAGDGRGRSRSTAMAQHHYRRRDGLISTVVIDGVWVTSLEETVVDCMLAFGFGEALAVADAALRLMRIDRDELVELVRRVGARRPGFATALRAASWADGLSESGGESMARAVMIEHGFVLPRLQVAMGNSAVRGESWRCDYLWELPDGTTVAGELDGLEKYENPDMTRGRSAVQVMSDERIRESRLTAYVDRVMRFTFADVIDEGRLVALLERFGIPRVGDVAAANGSNE